MRVPSICVYPGQCGKNRLKNYHTVTEKILISGPSESAIKMSKDSDNIGTQHIELLNSVVEKHENSNTLLIILIVVICLCMLFLVLYKIYEKIHENARLQAIREMQLSKINISA